ncbi:MAG: beta-propeller domain-containing protein [Lachnospiraceae bacterium]|nr:beta-propeller domain-containing protein [bacterium]MDY5516251.1 beta-propeller domain-containing protein [Lachnospiraceae bacterium]
MEEHQLLEKLQSEAQTVEVPPELEPEQIRVRIETEGGRTSMKKQGGQKQKRFHWHGYGSRVAAAAIVLVASLGAFGVANSQDIVPITVDDQAVSEADSSKQENKVATEEQAESNDDSSAASENNVPEPVKTLGDYQLADSYEEVCEMLNTLVNARNYNYAVTYGMEAGAADGSISGTGDALAKEESAADMADMASSGVSSNGVTDLAEQEKQAAEKADYSTTNLQVTGVDESDIVKTDGQYIYIATNDKVQIVDVRTDTPSQLGSITPELTGNMDRIREMYVEEGQLILIVQTEDTDGLEQVDEAFYAKEDIMVDLAYDPIRVNSVHTQVLTYDITSPAGAKLVGTFTQDGSYNTSRKIGDQLYLFTDYGYPLIYPYYRTYQYVEEDGVQQNQDVKEETTFTQEEVEKQLPKIQGETIPENCIYLPKEGTESGVLISSMNVKEPEKVMDQKMIFSGYSSLYVTKDSIILYCSDYDMENDSGRTNLTKFAIGDGRITADCAESVPGYIEDTFAIHENKDGYVYVLTTDYTMNGTTNQLFVLDQRLKIHGRIEHIADGENVYAARFVDDIGYFVTYRNMDPLFTVDFSDPANPTLIGELEIPGFSDYLQFWDDTHLIGVGEERKEENSEFIGIKVSLYDISDPTNVKESAKIVMDDACYAPAQYNYKALLADSRKNVIAFLTQDKGDTYQISQRIFTVQDGALEKAGADRISQEEWEYSTDSYRNLYIGDKLYLVREGLVIVYDMTKNFERMAVCKLT